MKRGTVSLKQQGTDLFKLTITTEHWRHFTLFSNNKFTGSSSVFVIDIEYTLVNFHLLS